MLNPVACQKVVPTPYVSAGQEHDGNSKYRLNTAHGQAGMRADARTNRQKTRWI